MRGFGLKVDKSLTLDDAVCGESADFKPTLEIQLKF